MERARFLTQGQREVPRTHMPTFKHYTTLGVQQNATLEDVRRSYRRLAVKSHPDKGGDKEAFAKITEAYEVLSDATKRAQYDRLGDELYTDQPAQPDPRGSFNPFSMFESMFDRRQHICARISLEEAYRGVQKKFRLSDSSPCPRCTTPCSACGGSGHVARAVNIGFLTQTALGACDACSGTGATRSKKSCTACKDLGRVNLERFADVHIPAGVPNGANLIVRGGESVEFVIQVDVCDHPTFKRVGNDLHHEAVLSFRDSVLGKRIVIKHFDGDIEFDTTPMGVVHNGQVHKINGKGMVGSTAGDLIVTMVVVGGGIVLTDEQRAAFAAIF